MNASPALIRRAAFVAALLIPLAPQGAAAARPAEAPSDAKVQVIVRYERTPGPADVARLRGHGASIRYRYRNIDAIAALAPASSLDDIRGDRGVRRVERDHPLELFDHSAATGDPELERAWGVEHIGSGRVHTAGVRGAGIRVAVIDTGIQCSHRDLDDNCDPGVSYIASAPYPNGVAFDDHGHGTHVAGSLGAEKSSDSYGVVGVAPRVRLVAMKVLDASGAGDYSGLIAALDQIATWNSDGDAGNDIDVVNMSLGGSEASETLRAAVDAAWASGAVLVAASGNVTLYQLFTGCPVAYPARYEHVLATTFTNGNDALTGYSCTGPEVDFASPGDSIYSTVPTSGGAMASTSGFKTASGTSMASPHLAGTAALLLSYGIADSNGNGNRQEEIKAHLCSTARQGYGVNSTRILPTDPRYPNYFGCGVINAGAALVDSPPGAPPPNDPPQVDAGGPYSGNEGAAVTVNATTSDPNGDPLSKTWTWQAGAGVDAGATCSFADPHRSDTTVTCTDDGTFTLTLMVDDGRASRSDPATLTLTNVAPSVRIDSPAPGAIIETGVQVSLARTVDDPGSNDTKHCDAEWGDGATSECGQGHTYATPGGVTIRATVTDDDGGSRSDSVTITIVEPPPNDPPVVDAGGPYGGEEGAGVTVDATTDDPDGDPLSKSWTWQAGAGVDAGATCSFAEPHQSDTSVNCTDDGTYALTLTVDDGRVSRSDEATLTLSNVAPSVRIDSPAPGARIDTGVQVSVERTVNDQGGNDTRTCRVDWGDGTETACTDTHAYAIPGERTIRATVTDDEGDSRSDSVAVTVVQAPIKVTFTPVADAYVYSARPTSNFGVSGRLRVQSGVYRSYVRFNVADVTGTVLGAKLRLYVMDASADGGTIRAVADTAWGERKITWNASPEMGATLGAVGQATNATWVEVDVSSVVTGNGAYSFAIAAGSGDLAGYHSRENPNDPQLVLTVMP